MKRKLLKALVKRARRKNPKDVLKQQGKLEKKMKKRIDLGSKWYGEEGRTKEAIRKGEYSRTGIGYLKERIRKARLRESQGRRAEERLPKFRKAKLKSGPYKEAEYAVKQKKAIAETLKMMYSKKHRPREGGVTSQTR